MARLNARQFIRPETSPSLSLADSKNVAKNSNKKFIVPEKKVSEFSIFRQRFR